MKALLLKIYHKAFSLYRKMKWTVQIRSIIETCEVLKDDYTLEITGQERALVVAPHADDELIGCYDFLKKNNTNTDVFCACLIGYEDSEANREVRRKEFVECCRRIQVHSLTPICSWKEELSNLLESGRYDKIFLPSLVDWHWEHREVTEFVLSTLNKRKISCSIFFYMVSVPMPVKYVNRFTVREGYKWNLFNEVYLSQQYMATERFRIIEKIYHNGDGQKVEPYVYIDSNSIDCFMKSYYSFSQDQLNELKTKINDITSIVDSSSSYYDLLRANC